MPTNKPEYQVPYYKKWYQENKETHKQNANKRRNRIVKENQQKIIEYLQNHPCIDCGETDIIVLQFDHVRGKKRKEIGAMLSFSWNTIMAEIEKCEVRCANDHIRKTARQQKSYKINALVAQTDRVHAF